MGKADHKAKRGRRLGKKILLVLLALIVLLAGWTLWGNITIGTTRITIESAKIPTEFDGYKIAQVSDLHNAEFGRDNEALCNILRREDPDIIALTGDLVDVNRTNIDIAVAFARQATQIAPTYFVIGNHEAWLGGGYEQLENQLISAGVFVLHNQGTTLTRDGTHINLAGIDDPELADPGGETPNIITTNEIRSIRRDDAFTVLLAHRPELFDTYAANDIDLVLAGHAHGGQVRIPFIGGLVAPDQGYFPQYDSGLYQQDETHMVVSRGLGNSTMPVRINNRPEVVVVTLSPDL